MSSVSYLKLGVFTCSIVWILVGFSVVCFDLAVTVAFFLVSLVGFDFLGVSKKINIIFDNDLEYVMYINLNQVECFD